jgi:RNA polymerase subunit RPABC4/transcription elongation factor Spt4
MSFQDRISHAAAVTKWKVDQQSRILKIQGQIRELENRIRVQKANLAEKALELYEQKNLHDQDLILICDEIANIHQEIRGKRNEEDTTKQERPPDMVYSSNLPSDVPIGELSGLVCPQCGRTLMGRFCPEHGVEGVTVSGSTTSDPTNQSEGGLVCPTCGRKLTGEFCPEHGSRGILR